MYQPVVRSPAWKLSVDLPSATTGTLVVDSTWNTPMRSRPVGAPTIAQSPSCVVVTVSVAAVASRVTLCWRTQKPHVPVASSALQVATVRTVSSGASGGGANTSAIGAANTVPAGAAIR